MHIKRLKDQGDTIIEVLLVIVIIGFILASAYVLVNQNTVAERRANERSQAIQLAQAQLEELRYFAQATGGINLSTQPSPFCMNGSGVSPTCTFNSDGSVAPAGLAFSYKVAISLSAGTIAQQHLVSISVSWPELGSGNSSGGIVSTQLVYRVYQ